MRFAAEGLAARAGIALQNAQRYRAQVDNVRMLTGALLPAELPRVERMGLTARYLPASGAVCGDWYEAESMPGDRVLLGIADASGHGLPAAVAMAQVRNAARGLAIAGAAPGQMLDHLGTLLRRSSPSSIVTAVYGLMDTSTGRGIWANAGHPPPIIIAPSGETSIWDLAQDPPIGSARLGYTEIEFELEDGYRMLLYTDGLFERRREDPTQGIRRLMALAESSSHLSDDELANAMLGGRPENSDDACILLIRR